MSRFNHVVDFETDKIEGRPHYPPKPVGVAIMERGRAAEYLAWGHPCENNCTKEQAVKRLRDIWKKGKVLFHNAKFDMDVAEVHLGLSLLPWDQWDDTMFLLFLNNPHSKTLSLKPAAEELLGIAPKERDKLKEWILAHIPEAKKKPSTWGAYISMAPGGLVGQYAKGDVTRPAKLFKLLWEKVIVEHGMLEPYEREKKVMPVLLRSERRGVPVDVRSLERDIKLYEPAIEKADAYLRKRLKVGKDFNLDSNDDLADALESSGLATGEFLLTDKGNRSTSKKSVAGVVEDADFIRMMRYRGSMTTAVRTFMRSWLETARQTNGRLHTSWNQVRQPDEREKGNMGTRTGRLSSSPNFQNIPKQFKDDLGEPLTPLPRLKLPPLPKMRSYFTAEKGHNFLHRDYNQQELRILAHFEDGDMCESYKRNPLLDFHSEAKENILEMLGVDYPRKEVKITNFGLIYGMGAGALAEKLGRDVNTARALKNAVLRAYPGLKELEKELRKTGADGDFIRTWGGRCYYSEEPRVIQGVMRHFEYKLLNYLIQGSAADCTKEALIRYEETHDEDDSHFLITVHDEINISAKKKAHKGEMEKLREAMEGLDFDIQMLSDGAVSSSSWAELKPFNDRR